MCSLGLCLRLSKLRGVENHQVIVVALNDTHLLEDVANGCSDPCAAALGYGLQILIDVYMDQGLTKCGVAGVEQIDALRPGAQCMKAEGSRIGTPIEHHGILGIGFNRLAVLPLVAVESALLTLAGYHLIIQTVFTEADGIDSFSRIEVLPVLIIERDFTELFRTTEGTVGGQQH
ncbi:hypothetical protein SDC9_60708 [bioreactor metagenome]|uniref:Uncharacterized protein n=1 Tax=bioreactor metagenome TaxID=1076179 RepID=A0A644XDP3_9ZZZZ